MRKADLQQQAVELIKQLSTENLQAGVDYLTYLRDKEGQEATHESATDFEIVLDEIVSKYDRAWKRWRNREVFDNFGNSESC